MEELREAFQDEEFVGKSFEEHLDRRLYERRRLAVHSPTASGSTTPSVRDPKLQNRFAVALLDPRCARSRPSSHALPMLAAFPEVHMIRAPWDCGTSGNDALEAMLLAIMMSMTR